MLLGEAIEDVDQLGEALSALGIALADPVGHAAFDVEFENDETDAVQRRLCRGELLEDFDAEPRFLDHAPDAADLSFDPVQPRDDSLLLCFVQHASLLFHEMCQLCGPYRNMSR